MNVDEILKDFEPTYRKRLERKVFESTIDGFQSMGRSAFFFGIPLCVHLSYLFYHWATNGGNWVAWVLTILFLVSGIGSVIFYPVYYGKGSRRVWQKFAEDSKWSITEFQRIAKQFPDQKKDFLLGSLETSLKEAAAFMA